MSSEMVDKTYLPLEPTPQEFQLAYDSLNWLLTLTDENIVDFSTLMDEVVSTGKHIEKMIRVYGKETSLCISSDKPIKRLAINKKTTNAELFFTLNSEQEIEITKIDRSKPSINNISEGFVLLVPIESGCSKPIAYDYREGTIINPSRFAHIPRTHKKYFGYLQEVVSDLMELVDPPVELGFDL